MILATIDTGSFQFTALGETEAAASSLLVLAWAKHRQERPWAEPALMVEAISNGDVTFTEIQVGDVIRDDSVILSIRD